MPVWEVLEVEEINREQRRKIESDLMKKQHIDRQKAKQLVYLSEVRDAENAPDIPTGTTVKLDTSKILSVTGDKNKNYLSFIKRNRNKVFHVSRDDPKATSTVVVLEEDDSPKKWLFWTGDLIVVEEESNV